MKPNKHVEFTAGCLPQVGVHASIFLLFHTYLGCPQSFFQREKILALSRIAGAGWSQNGYTVFLVLLHSATSKRHAKIGS